MRATATDTATDTAKWHRRLRDVALWMRDTGLGAFGVALLIAVAASGWGGSTLGLRDFAATRMGYHGVSAWLVPATFDGASVGLSIVAFRAAIHGRGAPLTRLGIAAFTSLSSWMNYMHITDTSGRRVAALLPIAGVALLESLLSEARRAHERRHGREQRERLHPLRFLFDFVGTWRIIRGWVMAVPLPQSVAASATDTDTGATDTTATATKTATPTATDTTATRATGTATNTTATDTRGATATATDTATVTATTTGATATDPGSGTATATVTPLRRTAATGKTAVMRAIFDKAVEEGRVHELTGAGLAKEANAHESLGRRYLPRWKAEQAASTAPSPAAEVSQ